MTNKENSGILIYAQLTRDEYIHTVFYELVDKAHELSKKLGKVDVNAVIFARPRLVDSFKESFQNKGLNKVLFHVNHVKLTRFHCLLLTIMNLHQLF